MPVEFKKQLIFHYQMRAMRDRRRVAMLRLRCAYALDPEKQSDSIWKVEIQDLDKRLFTYSIGGGCFNCSGRPTVQKKYRTTGQNLNR